MLCQTGSCSLCKLAFKSFSINFFVRVIERIAFQFIAIRQEGVNIKHYFARSWEAYSMALNCER